MSLPPILVINLERSKDRRAHMEKELGRFGVDYSFFPGVDGKKLSEENRKCYSLRQAVALKGIGLGDGHIGCSLAHAIIYKKMVAEKMEELLILEDDCFFDASFFELLACRQEWLPPGWGIVNFSYAYVGEREKDLYAWTRVLDFPKTSHTPFRLGKFKVPHMLCSCYFINLHAARRLLSVIYPIRAVASSIMGDITLHQLESYTILPSIVQVDGFSSDMIRGGKLNMLWQALIVAIRYRDARKGFFKARMDGLRYKLSRLYRWLMRK